MTAITAADLVTATERAAVTLGSTPALTRLYAPDVIATVLRAFVVAWTGAGSMETASERMASDHALADVPEPVVAALMVPCMEAFAAALMAVRGDG